MVPPPVVTGPIPIGTSIKRIGSKRESNYHTLIPNVTLWKAGLALEAIYPLLPKAGNADNSLWEEDTLALLLEALSDFSTLAASCQDHILQLIEACNRSSKVNLNATDDYDESESVMLSSMLSHKAELLCKVASHGSSSAGSNKLSTITGGANDPNIHVKAGDVSKGGSTSRFPPCDLGQALWLSFRAIIHITQVLLEMAPKLRSSKTKKQEEACDFTFKLLEASFSPSLAVLQHYLKRLPGSIVLTGLSLQGYRNLASVVLPLASQDSSTRSEHGSNSATIHCVGMQRKALLSSLSKLSLPAWGKRDGSG
jgi:hypothetical protein